MMWLEKPEYKYRIKEFAGRYTIEVEGEVTTVTGWWWNRVDQFQRLIQEVVSGTE